MIYLTSECLKLKAYISSEYQRESKHPLLESTPSLETWKELKELLQAEHAIWRIIYIHLHNHIMQLQSKAITEG